MTHAGISGTYPTRKGKERVPESVKRLPGAFPRTLRPVAFPRTLRTAMAEGIPKALNTTAARVTASGLPDNHLSTCPWYDTLADGSATCYCIDRRLLQKRIRELTRVVRFLRSRYNDPSFVETLPLLGGDREVDRSRPTCVAPSIYHPKEA